MDPEDCESFLEELGLGYFDANGYFHYFEEEEWSGSTWVAGCSGEEE